MGILIANDGTKFVNNIAERNSITNKYEGLTVVVKDAIADPIVGGAFEATYRWNVALATWLMTHKNAKDNINFTREEKIIVDGKVTADHAPQTSTIMAAYIVDENGLELATVTPSVLENVVSIGSTAYDGKTLIYTYAYGAVQAAISNLGGVQSTIQW